MEAFYPSFPQTDLQRNGGYANIRHTLITITAGRIHVVNYILCASLFKKTEEKKKYKKKEEFIDAHLIIIVEDKRCAEACP